MNNFFRAIIAGYGAKKLGGGCFGTIIVFILIWVALGQCSLSSREIPPPESYPADRRATLNWESPYIANAPESRQAKFTESRHLADELHHSDDFDNFRNISIPFLNVVSTSRLCSA